VPAPKGEVSTLSQTERQEERKAMIEDKATEKLKKRAQDLGLIVNAGADEKQGTIESQTAITQKLDSSVKWTADGEMAGKKRGGKQ
jgi:hypothetical protein